MDKLIIKRNFRSAANESGGLGMPLGHFREALLRVVSSLDGVTIPTIRRTLEDAFGVPVAPGAIYTTLARLNSDEQVSYFKGEPSDMRGGKAMNIYLITAKGWRVLEEQERKNQIIKSMSGSRPVPRKTAPRLIASGL